MMKNITPVAALLAAFFYSFAIALQAHLFLPMFLPLLFLVAIKFKALIAALKQLLFLNIFIVIIVISLLLQNDTHTALLIFIRSNIILLFVLLLFSGKNEFDIALAFSWLKMPCKLVSILFFTAKFIFLIRREFTLFKRALYIRGFKPKTDLLSYKIMAGFVGILVIKAVELARSLQKSMLLRGFEGEVYTLRARQSLNIYDKLLFFITVISLFLRVGVIV